MRRMFQQWLFVCIAFAFCVTFATTHFRQTSAARRVAAALIRVNLEDVRDDVRERGESLALLREMDASVAIEKARSLAYLLEADPSPLRSRAALTAAARSLDVDEAHIANAAGIVVASTDDVVGYDMAAAAQSAAFLPATRDPSFELVQPPMPRGADGAMMRYAGVARLDEPGIVQIGYRSSRIESLERAADIANLAFYYHIGADGGVLVARNDVVVSSKDSRLTGKSLESCGIDPEAVRGGDDFLPTIDGAPCLAIGARIDEYDVIGFLPAAEMYEWRNTTLLYTTVGNAALFAVVFLIVSFLVRRLVIDDVYRVNSALARIAGGDLKTRLDIGATPEFRSLSSGVNAMALSLERAIAKEAARIDGELEFARTIQLSALPSVFPPYPLRTEFDLYATMRAAREVGGDFYDFTMVDDDHLAVTIADVSGKGIGAALFMMTAKTLLKDLAESGLPPAEILTRANAKLCENNEAEMFLTVFLGVLEIGTGVFTYANAGHNAPLLRSGGAYNILKGGHGLVLAAMAGVRYAEESIVLKPGDRIVLYTDGVTEAVNPRDELFTETRLLDWLNAKSDLGLAAITNSLLDAVGTFAEGAEQADDITLLLLEYAGRDAMTLPVVAAVENLPKVLDFIEGRLREHDCPERAITPILLAAEEAFVNIAHYAYRPGTGHVAVRCLVDGRPPRVTLQFLDRGAPFNPIEHRDPDTTLSAEQREEGGLGILIVKKSMDDIGYEYLDGKNILTLRKTIFP